MSGPTHVVVHYSFGIGSWAAGLRALERFGRGAVSLVFADTLMEHPDCYRFGIEGAAMLIGVSSDVTARIAARALALPLPDSDESVAERRALLVGIRADAVAAIPGLIWLCDGRTTFEAMRDARFIGNSRLCPAAKFLKHAILDAWMREHAPSAVVAVGLDWSEQDRIQRLAKALRARGGWTLSAPLARAPRLEKADMLALAVSHGLRPSVAYTDDGLSHDNCSGLCVRGGKGHWAQVRRTRPGAFRYAMEQERQLRSLVGDFSMLTETRLRQKRNLPLYELDARLRTAELTAEEATEIGGCGCLSEDAA